MITALTKETIARIYQKMVAQPGYRERESQQSMIRAVASTLGQEQDRILAVEAPIGTGKSYAYLTAAIPIACAQGKRLVVSTSTVALQEQIVQRDLPRFLSVTGLTCEYRIAKGRGRYVCPLRLNAHAGYDDRHGDLFRGVLEMRADRGGALALAEAFDLCEWDGDRDSWTSEIDEET